MNRTRIVLLLTGIIALVLVVFLIRRVSTDGGEQAEEQASTVKRPEIYFESDPRIVEYQLKRLSNEQLVLVERSPDSPRYRPVYEALLTRSGVDREYRDEAVRALAELKHSDAISEILSAMEQMGSNEVAGDDRKARLQQLREILLAQDPSDLEKKRALLEQVATGSHVNEAKEGAFAALVLFAPAENVWQLASNTENGLTTLVRGLPLVPDSTRIEPFYPRAKSLLVGTVDRDLRDALIEALPSFGMHHEESFVILAEWIRQGTAPDAAIHSIQRIPRDKWADVEVEPLVEHLVDYARRIPIEERTGSRFLNAVQLGNDLASRLDSERTRTVRALLDDLGVRTIVIRTVLDQMRYDTRQVVVEVGEHIELVLENRDYMLHNLVITQPGAREEVGMAAERMPPEPDAQGRYYVPRWPWIRRDPKKILLATKLVAPNEKEVLSFVAPDEPGSYPYLCTFPGHWRLMYGDLVVVADMDEYLANPSIVAAAPEYTEWKVADLVPELSGISADRSARGREVFSSAGCDRCHRLSGQGAEFGPDLAGVFARWDNSDVDVLKQIVEPSSTIRPEFVNQVITLKDGSIETGIIAGESDTSLTIQSGPGEAFLKTLDKKDIAERREQKTSVMPSGILNTLEKEDIVDLLAFLKYGSPEPVHNHSEEEE